MKVASLPEIAYMSLLPPPVCTLDLPMDPSGSFDSYYTSIIKLGGKLAGPFSGLLVNLGHAIPE